MSSISGLGSSQYSSPLQQLQAELQSEVSAGTISSTDQSALSSALTSIDSSLNAGQSSSPSQASGSQGSRHRGPGDIKSKINDLIQAQVTSGALTSDQANELQNLFSNTFGNGPGGQGGPAGPGGPQGAGGPPPGGPPPGASPSGDGSSTSSAAAALQQLLDSSSSSSSSSSADGSSDSSSTDGTSASTVLKDFLKLLQDAQSFAYGANGATTASSAGTSSLINYQA
ncbi:MAG TPA: hypothetical protein VFL62_08575 [Bradyrhizobium sp.]|uniref:hypothetical protein n=1 Tax=Bradyrhizobium sp. TaxID=376 RepID=UPI002D7E3F2F|nr:hypothetical protein [Bradyrhizobium sp.]HET7886265.1 hypothetical protein [Bradyrhizobium sp.]